MNRTAIQLALPITLALVIAFVAFAVLAAALFPWEPPETDALRVQAPAGEPYTVEYGNGTMERARLDRGEPYRDHALRGGDGSLVLHKGHSGTEIDGNPNSESPDWKGTLQAVLYQDGEVAGCDSVSGGEYDISSTQITASSTNSLSRSVCEGYRYFGWFVVSVGLHESGVV